MLEFRPAQKQQAKLRMAVTGPSGSGKTMTALRIAKGLDDAKPAVIDTEAGSASLYSDRYPFDGLVLKRYLPRDYIAAIEAAEKAGYAVVIIDSLSHEWAATLAEVDARAASMKNKAAAWNGPSQDHQALVERILQSSVHIIATMRSHTEYDLSGGDVKKLGLAPVQREGVDYEFTVVGDLNLQHTMRITKTRYSAIADQSFREPGEDLGRQLKAWLSEGEPAMGAVTGKAVDESLTTAAAATEQGPYTSAVALLKGWGYANRAEFLRTGTEQRGQEVLAILSAAPLG